MSIRKPKFANMFYSGDFEQLEKSIKVCFDHKLGPGELPVSKRKGKLKAIIAPHAGYPFSGPCAAWVYKEIAESEIPDTFLIMGTAHSNPLTCISKEDYETPFGIVRNDHKLADLLEEHGIKVYNTAHNEEHSIEVQLPFLQFACSKYMKSLKFVPMVIGQEDYEDTAGKIQTALEKYPGKVMIIVSSDFTHYGSGYGYTPFVYNIKEELYKLDKGAIKFILENDHEGFTKYCDDTGATICGRQAISVMLKLFEEKKVKIELLQYYTSGDMNEEYSNSVGYAGITIK